MSELRDLRDDAADAREVRELLRGVPPSRGMTADERARSRARLVRHVSIAAVAGGLSWIPGAALGAGLGVIVGAASLFAPGWPAPSRAAAPAPAVTAPVIASAHVAASAAPSSSASAEASAPASAEPLPPAPRASAAAPSSTGSAEPAAAVDVLAEEVALLDRARAALASSPAQALALADEHAARFPRGKLGMEREMVAIDALRRLGREGEAKARGDAVLSRARGSLYEERIRKVVEGAR